MSPAVLCFIVTYGMGVVLKKTPNFRADWLGYVLIVLSGVFYMLIGEQSAGRNPLIRGFVDGVGIGIIAWLLHYYHEQLPLLKKVFPDTAETVEAKRLSKARLARKADNVVDKPAN